MRLYTNEKLLGVKSVEMEPLLRELRKLYRMGIYNTQNAFLSYKEHRTESESNDRNILILNLRILTIFNSVVVCFGSITCSVTVVD